MGQILGPDKLFTPVVDSITNVRLPGVNVVTIGGQQYALTDKVMDASDTGLGGLDTGVLGNNLTYNLFAVTLSGIAGLVGSLASFPSGFIAYTLVGTFETGGSANINVAREVNPNFELPDANFDISPNSGSGTIGWAGNGVFINVPNMTATLTTTGRPVEISARSVPSGEGSIRMHETDNAHANLFAIIRLLRGGVEQSRWRYEIEAQLNAAVQLGAMSLPSFTHFDSVGAGTHIYQLQAYKIQSNDLLQFVNLQLVAREVF